MRLLFLERHGENEEKKVGEAVLSTIKGGDMLQVEAVGGESCIVESNALRFGRCRDGGIFLLPDVKFIAQLNPVSYANCFDF